MSLRNVTAEPSLPSTLPRLRPLPRWGSTMAFQLFPEQPPLSLTPRTPLQAALKLIRSLGKEFQAASSAPGGWHPGCHKDWKKKLRGGGQRLGWNSISRGFIWLQALCQA